MNYDFNPEHPLERFMYGSEEEMVRAWEELLAGPVPPRETLPAEAAEIASFGAPGLCPEAGEWISIVCGQSTAEERESLLAHAAGCAGCAARLREGIRLFSVELPPKEDAALSSALTTTPAWRHQMAVELAQTPRREPRGWFSGITLWGGAVLTAALIAAVGLSLWWQQRNTPERMLAEVYSRCRCYDLRMDGAGYSQVDPTTHLRGGQGNQDTAVLTAACTRIEDHLKRSPHDAHWLQLEARADLLQEKLDPAIEILDGLLASAPPTSSLLADDAAAYFQRGLITGSESDRSNALDKLRRADELTPGNTVVLFNEAIVEEDRGQRMNAVETWNRFLRFEHDPSWQAEGRRRLQALELKLQPAGK
jgi:tetratricopeptide (TPR) repeat protein